MMLSSGVSVKVIFGVIDASPGRRSGSFSVSERGHPNLLSSGVSTYRTTWDWSKKYGESVGTTSKPQVLRQAQDDNIYIPPSLKFGLYVDIRQWRGGFCLRML